MFVNTAHELVLRNTTVFFPEFFLIVTEHQLSNDLHKYIYYHKQLKLIISGLVVDYNGRAIISEKMALLAEKIDNTKKRKQNRNIERETYVFIYQL